MKYKAEAYNSPTIDEIFNSISPEEAGKIEKKMLLAAKIEDAMKAKGWKNKDFAKALKKQPSEITKWLSGTHNFTVETLWEIERVLDIELVALEERKMEQIITVQLSTTEVLEIEEPEEPVSFEQLFFADVLTMSPVGQKQLKRSHRRISEIYQA